MKKKLGIISLLLLLIITNVMAEDAVIELNKKSYRMELNSTQKVDYKINLDVDYEIKISSSNENIVRVEVSENSFLLTAVSPGKASISIWVITENDQYEETVEVEILPEKGRITFDKDTFYLIRGLYYDIEYVLEPKNIDKSNIVWTSSNPEVASVVNGRVTGHKIGSTQITATLDGHVATMDLFVTVPLEKIEFNPSEVVIELEEAVEIPDLIYVPYDTTSNKTVNYTIEDESIVKLEDGMLVGLKEGETKVIAKVNGVDTSLNVKVKRKALQTDVQPILLGVIQETDEALILGLHELETYQGGKYELLLPVEELQAYMENREESKIFIQLDDTLRREKFLYLSNMEVSKELLLLLGAQKLEFVFTDTNLNPLVSLKFNQNYKSPYNFTFDLNKIDTNHALYPIVKTSGAYQLKVKEVLDGTVEMGIHRRLLDTQQDQLHFIYEYKDKKIEEVSDPIEVLGNGFVNFTLANDEMIISTVPLSSQDNWVIYMFGGLVVLIVGGILLKAFSKRSKNVL